MEYVEIPGLPFPVSRIGLGTWAIGGRTWGGADEAEAIRTLHAAFDAGVNLVDTAPVYGFGRAEEIVGKALAGRRGRVVVATKLGLDWSGGRIRRDGSPARVAQEVEDSLRRLQVEIIDLYQVHWPDPATPLEETARAIEELVRAGKVRAVGISGCSPQEMERFGAAARIATVHPPYNVFEREVEKDVLPWCSAHGIPALAFGALCRGLLSGRMSPETTFEGDRLREKDRKFHAPDYHAYLAAVAALDAFAREVFGRTVLELAVRWLLDRPGISVAIWGARRPSQLDPLPRVLGWRIDAAAMARIDEIALRHVPRPEEIRPEEAAP